MANHLTAVVASGRAPGGARIAGMTRLPIGGGTATSAAGGAGGVGPEAELVDEAAQDLISADLHGLGRRQRDPLHEENSQESAVRAPRPRNPIVSVGGSGLGLGS